jgi:hypothetical protein
MKTPKTRVISLRLPVSEFVELLAEAETKNLSAAGVLLAAWRERKSQAPVDVRLLKIEAAISEARTENTHKFQRLADGLNQLIQRIK